MIKERRKHLRAKKQVPLKIADKGFDIITETVDISSSGIYCRVTRLLPMMSKIAVMLLLPSKTGNGKHAKKIRCKGVIVRSEPIILKDAEKAHYNVAIFFTDVSEKDQKVIESYLQDTTNPNSASVELKS
ncbi:MAG: PilZ domain-containing protein [Candidatus Omnitrophota bacterium]